MLLSAKRRAAKARFFAFVSDYSAADKTASSERMEFTAMAQKYDYTLNLPKTDFPMRAGLPKREPEMLAHWQELDIYN